MYRFFVAQKNRLRTINGGEGFFKLVTGDITSKSCDLCGFTCISALTRYQSTHTNPNLKTRRLRKRRYVDLLMVTDKSTNEYKTKVTNLSPDDLNFLASTNLNLSELYKLEDMMKMTRFVNEHTYNNLAIIDNINNIEIIKPPPVTIPQEESISDPELEIIEDGHLSLNSFQPEIAEEEELDVSEEAIDSKRENVINYSTAAKSLGAYLDVCSGLGNPQKGLNALHFHRSKSKFKSEENRISIESYNALLKGFSFKGNINKIEEVLKLIKADNVKLNIQSFVFIFECLGRNKLSKEKISLYVSELNEFGFDFNRIFNEGIFVENQREFVLKAIRFYDKNFIPEYTKPDLSYSNRLVNDLNKIEPKPESEPENDSPRLLTVEEMHEKIREQIRIEKAGYVTVENIDSPPNPSEETLKHRKTLQELLKTWETDALNGFKRDLAAIKAKHRKNMSLEPYLRAVPAVDVASIIVNESITIAQGSETYSPTIRQLHRDLGRKLYSKYCVLRKEKDGVLEKVLKIHTKYCEDYSDSHRELGVSPVGAESELNPRLKWKKFEFELKAEGASADCEAVVWPPQILQQIGKFLYNIVMRDLKVDVNVTRNKKRQEAPAFYSVFRSRGRAVSEEAKPHPALARLLRAAAPSAVPIAAVLAPSGCPPVPWSGLGAGGYLLTPTDAVRPPPGARPPRERLARHDARQLYPSFDSLNQLGDVAWKVNTRILDLVIEVFRNGGSAELNVPEDPWKLEPPVQPQKGTEIDPAKRSQLLKEKLQWRRRRAEMHSLRCDCLYRLSLANHYRDEIFWLPHNMDFRGRVYPVPPHLNHLGSDLARAMLVFAESRPLGPEGLAWLKLHLVNLTGLKKRDPISARLEFADSVLPDILDSADKPLTGRKFWLRSDEPWQTLACATEIAAAVRSGDPESFRSCFPVHQDGSCNGLQHYAALGRDAAGGFSVNLTAAERPQDVYSAVAELVEEKRTADDESGLEIARILRGFVKRKVIKQTVMTTVYGVTRYGARLQIARQLKDLDGFPKEHVWAASSYLTVRTFESLRSMFRSTREIQDWFVECARLIASVRSEPVEWTTPLGLPVTQPYFRRVKQPIGDRPNILKQKNAFPPNFVHSLDSSHMMLTALYCARAGVRFVSVHDCYWTHAATVRRMNRTCREQFVALHREPILRDLATALAARFAFPLDELRLDGSPDDLARRRLNETLARLPKTGDFDLKEVLDSVYFFS